MTSDGYEAEGNKAIIVRRIYRVILALGDDQGYETGPFSRFLRFTIRSFFSLTLSPSY